MNPKSIGLHIEFTKTIPSGVEALMEETIYGREEKLQYKHKNAIKKLRDIESKLIFSIKRNDKIISSAVFVERQTSCRQQSHLSFYIRYLSFNKSFKSNKQQRYRFSCEDSVCFFSITLKSNPSASLKCWLEQNALSLEISAE